MNPETEQLRYLIAIHRAQNEGFRAFAAALVELYRKQFYSASQIR
jgi:hypothetical protein